VRPPSIAACEVFVWLVLMAAPANADKAPLLPSPITHGQYVDASRVGPAVSGVAQGTTFIGGEIRDGKPMPFARVIAESATYDTYAVAGPHLLIEGATFTSALDIYSRLPIVFRGVTVRTEGESHWAIHTRPGAGPFYFLWSQAGAADGRSAPGSTALLLRADDAVVYRSHISNASDAIHADAAGAILRENLLDGLITHSNDHNDGIQIAPQARSIVIERNRILNANPQTSCIYNAGSGVIIHDNYLAGGGWVIYGGAKNNGHAGESAKDVSVSGNIFGLDYFLKSGNFGPVAYWDTANTWANNRTAAGKQIKP
jgi:hypothetical protein